MQRRPAEPRLDPRIRLVVAGSFVTVAARMSLVTFLSIYFVRQAGIDLTLVGIAFLVENLSRGVLAPWFGALTDRIGRRPVLLAGLVANALVLPGFLLVTGPFSLIAWSLAMGLAGAVQWPASTALLLDLAPPERRQYVLAIHYTLVNVGYSVGTIPGGFLAEQGYGVLAFGSAAGYFAVALLYGLGLRGPLPQDSSRNGQSALERTVVVARDKVFLGFALAAFAFPLSIGLFAFASVIYAAERGLSESFIGLVLGANGLMVALLAVPIAKRIERLGPYQLLGPCGIVLSGCFVCYALVPDPAWALIAGMLLYTFADLVFGAALPTAVSHLAPHGLRGTYQGAWSLVMALGMGGSLYASGLLRTAFDWATAWLVFAALAFATGIALIVTRERFRRASLARSGSGQPESQP